MSIRGSYRQLGMTDRQNREEGYREELLSEHVTVWLSLLTSLFFVPKLPEGLLQKPRVVCGINACDNRPMHRGSRRVSTDVQHPGVPLAALHSVAGR